MRRVQDTCNPGRQRRYLQPAAIQTSALIIPESSNEESSGSDATWGWCSDRNDQGQAEQVARGCQECHKNSALFAQFLLSSLTYVLLSYFVRLHCANIHTPSPLFLIFDSLRAVRHDRSKRLMSLRRASDPTRASLAFTPPPARLGHISVALFFLPSRILFSPCPFRLLSFP